MIINVLLIKARGVKVSVACHPKNFSQYATSAEKYITGVTIKAMKVFIKLNRVCREKESNVGEAMGVVSEGKARAKETRKEHHWGRRMIRTHYVMQANRMRGSKKKIQGLVQKPVGREKRQ